MDRDLSSSIVQEIAASLVDSIVPDKYIHTSGFPPSEGPIAEDLTIDFSRLWAEEEIEKLRRVLSTWGCFMIVNHGIEKEVLEKVLEVSRRFFALPLQEKKKWYGDEWGFNGYGNDGLLWGNQTQNWNDRLYLRVSSKQPDDLGYWPGNPPEFRQTLDELVEKIEAMPETILKALSRSLNLEDDCFLKHHSSEGGYTIKFNFYPRCPDPNRVLGIVPHSDGSLFTMLLTDQQGLEIMANERWFMVPVIPGALFVNVGDLMEIMSNGMIKSTLHRAVTNSEEERVSAAMFYNPGTFEEIGPIDELVTDARPKLYKKTSILKYGQVYRDFNPKGLTTLSAFRL